MSARKPGAVIVLLVGVLFAAAASAAAARQPTFSEREALTASLPQFIQKDPVGCVFLDTRVSRNGRYATVSPVFLNASTKPCLTYASNGYWILEKTAKWKIVFNGSDQPPCSLAVPRDLTRCN